jgi:hypothetical protein
VAEHTNITNLLLLSVLAGILLVGGGLQCAFDCLTQADNRQSVSARVDTCHLYQNQPNLAASCPDKACHQSSPHHRNLDSPEIYRLQNIAQPLYSSPRQPEPQFRAGTAFVLPPTDLQQGLLLHASLSDIPFHTLFSIRTTVILC